MNKRIILLIGLLFLFRLMYGLCSEFWFVDELQIYLIGLKAFTSQTWPYYGPDVVYTNTQIPGALQGLLVALPFYILKIPEAPTILLNLLTFSSLALLVYYGSKRINSIPSWLLWVLIMTFPWTMGYGTRVVNPSYVLIFSVPFLIGLLELLPIYKNKILSFQLSFFLLGSCTACIFQLHLSWVLLLPLTGLVFLFRLRKDLQQQGLGIGFYILGILVGGSLLIPTLLLEVEESPSVAQNVVFQVENWGNLPIIILRFFSFASYEIPYALGGSSAVRLAIISEQWWMTPITLVLLVLGFAQVGLFLIVLFIKDISIEFKKIRWLVVFCIIMLYSSFFFSVKGPASHTFCILVPLALLYSFYAYDWLFSKSSTLLKKKLLKLLKAMAIMGVLFHIGLGLYNFEHKSLYRNRNQVKQALEQMDYTILGKRRADEWGYGY